jgi:hypothetical protein
MAEASFQESNLLDIICPINCFNLAFTEDPFSSNNVAKSCSSPFCKAAWIQRTRAFLNYKIDKNCEIREKTSENESLPPGCLHLSHHSQNS